MRSCYTLAVLLGIIFNMNNVVPNLEQSNTLWFMGSFIIGGVVAPPRYGPRKKVPITAVYPPPHLISGIQNMQARFGGPTSRSSGLPHR